MPKRIFSNFRGGINAAPGYYPQAQELSASDIRNLEVNANGELMVREGHQVLYDPWATGSSPYSSGHYLEGQTNIDQSAPYVSRIIPTFYTAGGDTRRFRMFVQRHTDGLYWWDGSGSTLWRQVSFAAPNIDPTNSSNSASRWDEPFSYTQYGNRLFLANGELVLWVDIYGVALDHYPLGYWWGFTPNSNDGYTPNVMPTLRNSTTTLTDSDNMINIHDADTASGGTYEDGDFYGFAVTYYNQDWNIESLPTNQAAIEIDSGSVRKVRIDFPTSAARTNNPLHTHWRVYRTAAQTSQRAAETAELYLIGDSTQWGGVNDPPDTDIDIGTAAIDHEAGGVTAILSGRISADENDNPPADLKYVISYGNRLWGARKDSSKVIFCKEVDGVPIPDAFPNDNADISHQFQVGDFSDPITGLEPDVSGQQLQVFKQNSVTMVRGWGTISGLYTPNTAVDLDASMVNNSAGTASPWSIVTEGGRTFFLGRDKQVWTSVGGQLTPISLAVQPILDQIPETAFHTNSDRPIHAVGHNNKYYLAIPTAKLWHNVEMTHIEGFFLTTDTTADSWGSQLNFVPEGTFSGKLDPPDTVLVYDILKDYWTTVDFRQGDDTFGNEVELENQTDGDHQIGQYVTAGVSVPVGSESGRASNKLVWGKLQNLGGTDAYLSYAYPRSDSEPLYMNTPINYSSGDPIPPTNPDWTRIRDGRDRYAIFDGSSTSVTNTSYPIRLWKSNWLVFPSETTITGLFLAFNDFSELGDGTGGQSVNYMLLRDDQNFWNYLGTGTSAHVNQDVPKKGVFARASGQHRACRNRIGLHLKCRRVQLVLYGDHFYQLERVGLEFNPRGEI